MKIHKAIIDVNDRIGDALNYTLYYNGKIDIRILDVITFFGFLFCVAYYYHTQGAMAAAQGALMYLFTALCVLWFFPSNKMMKD